MIKVAICEREISLSGVMEALVLKAGELLTLKLSPEVFFTGGSFLSALERGEAFQIVIAGLEPGDISGIELGLSLRRRFSADEAVLIYTSSGAMLPDGILDAQPFGMVRMPVDEKDFLRKIFSAWERLQKSDELFICKQGRTMHQIKKRDVICLESAGRDIILSVLSRPDIEYREALKNEAEKLTGVNFIRPHNSFIVNLDYVEQYRTDSLLLTNKKLVPISELKLREIKRATLKFWEYRNIYSPQSAP